SRLTIDPAGQLLMLGRAPAVAGFGPVRRVSVYRISARRLRVATRWSSLRQATSMALCIVSGRSSRTSAARSNLSPATKAPTSASSDQSRTRQASRSNSLMYSRKLPLPKISHVQNSSAPRLSASHASSAHARAIAHALRVPPSSCTRAPSASPSPVRTRSLFASSPLVLPARPARPSPAAPRVPPTPSPSPATPMPSRIRCPPKSLVLARPALSASSPPRPRASRPPSALQSPMAHPAASAALHAVMPPNANASQSTSAACSHPRTPVVVFVTLSRASRPDARPTPDSRSSSTPLPTDSVGSPGGHGSHPSNPIQSPARQIQPSFILLLPPFRTTILRTRLFLAHGLHQHFSSFVFA
ncbi:Unknown protein, partial [Striga hermonthica]